MMLLVLPHVQSLSCPKEFLRFQWTQVWPLVLDPMAESCQHLANESGYLVVDLQQTHDGSSLQGRVVKPGHVR
jgi:hypothetical protein